MADGQFDALKCKNTREPHTVLPPVQSCLLRTQKVKEIIIPQAFEQRIANKYFEKRTLTNAKAKNGFII